MDRFLYFRTEPTDADDDGAGNSVCYPASSLVGMQPVGDSALSIFFSVDDVVSSILLNLTTANTHAVAMQAITSAISSSYSPSMIVVANNATGRTQYLENSGISSCGRINTTSTTLVSVKITTATAVEIIDIDSKLQPLTSMTLANVHSADATVQVYLLNAAGTLFYIIKDVVIPTGVTLKLEADELDYDGNLFNLYVKLGGSTPVDVIVR